VAEDGDVEKHEGDGGTRREQLAGEGSEAVANEGGVGAVVKIKPPGAMQLQAWEEE
jgi:hypothetical protein